MLQWLPGAEDPQALSKGKVNIQMTAALLHKKLSQCVTKDKDIKKLAEDAFR